MNGTARSLDAAMTAAPTLSAGQRRAGISGLAIVVLLLLVRPQPTLVAIVGVLSFTYLGILSFRIRLFADALAVPGGVGVSDEDARTQPDHRLPVYTVLVPVLREPEVMLRLIAELVAIDYPTDRLDIRVLVEADDDETRSALQNALAVHGAKHIQAVVVPDGGPRTKPNALNAGLVGATGQFVTVYDAEDRPDPLQLRRAVAAFHRVGPDVACLQAHLDFYNADQNLITSWFTAEYLLWFTLLLPGLVARDAPVPLGGTSNHVRREVLEEVGGWDATNVTEDADLGVRLRRCGYRVEVLASTTHEEANSDFVNWVKQRSRWYKGYLQTWLVHTRSPRRLVHEIGFRGSVAFTLLVGGTPVLALLSPLFWLLNLLWFIGRPAFVASLFPAPLYYVSLVCWILGNFSVIYMGVLAARVGRRPELVRSVLVMPVYWLMMAVAAQKAVLQLVVTPTLWEKTAHGLDAPLPSAREAVERG